MSKFRVIDGNNVTSIVSTSREVKQLELEIEKKTNPSDRDLVVFAYHFVRLGNFLLAQKYLNRLDPDYFDVYVYKDLSRALLVWSVVQNEPQKKTQATAAIYEYFIILKRVVEIFDEVNFQTKPAFLRFKKQFNEFTTTPAI